MQMKSIGRPPKSAEEKHRILRLGLKPADLNRLNEVAQDNGTSLAGAARLLILKALQS